MTTYAPELAQSNGNGDGAYQPASGSTKSEGELLRLCQERLRQARSDRSRYEGTWSLCQHYLAGKQWVALTGGRDQRVVALAETDEWRDRVRITVNVLTRYVWTAVGKIVSDELRPDFTFLAESTATKEYASQANAAWRFGYENEIEGDRQVKSAILKMLTYGTGALHARYDFGAGRVSATLPIGEDGQPLTYDMEEARAVVAAAHEQDVYLPTRDLREGALCWDPYGPQNIFVPPGIDDEKNFPWLILGRTYDLDSLKLLYPDAADLQSEPLQASDRIGSFMDAGGQADNTVGKVENATMVYTKFCRPSTDYPNGYKVIWAQDRILEVKPTLPYEVSGVKKAGIVFLKWRPVPNRFWAIGMVEPGIGPQFELNRSVSQDVEMKDRNLGRVYVTKGTITGMNRPQGFPMEVVELAPGAPPPVETAGMSNPNLQAQTEMQKQHISDTLGMGATSLGQAPRGVSAYSAFAFMVEQDDKDLIAANQDLRDRIAELAGYSLQDIRAFKGPEWKISMAGPEGQMQNFIFDATQIPPEFVVVAKRTVAIPKAQSAELQKIFDIFDRSISSGRPLPLDWLWESLDQGRALELPKSQDATQRQKAELENMLIPQGQPMMPAPEDDDESHVNVHVAAKVAYMMNPQVVALFDQHIQMHIMSAQNKMRASALATQEAAGNSGPKFENQAAPAGAAQPPIS